MYFCLLERELHPTTLNCEVKKALPASEKALEEATFFVNTDEMDEALKMIRPKPKPVAETVYLSTEPMNTMSSISSDIGKHNNELSHIDSMPREDSSSVIVYYIDMHTQYESS